MFELIKYRPHNELRRMGNYLDRFFLESLPVMYQDMTGIPEMKIPAVDILENEQSFIVKASVPGFKKEELDISVDGDLLTLKGETSTSEEKEEKDKYYHKEITSSSFARSIRLPKAIKKEEIKAAIKDGILQIEIPKVEEKGPEKILIES